MAPPETISAEEYRKQAFAGVPEKVWQDRLLRLFKHNGWLTYHVYDSRRSTPGFPDLVLVHPDPAKPRLMFLELKTERGRPTAAQRAWLGALRNVARAVNRATGEPTMEAAIARPSDYETLLKKAGGKEPL